MPVRTQILIRGTVQGVGFRPFVYSLATRRSLKGIVLNNSSGVVIDVEGDAASIGQFVDDIKLTSPPLSIVESIAVEHLTDKAGYNDFRIVESDGRGSADLPVAADVATCDDCRRELFDPMNRRYRYPFINCTNCGPRFTIVESVPYDRERTTMRKFEMCAECRAEYEDPNNRRFHAEPIACAACGPTLVLSPTFRRQFDPIVAARELLADGKIIAIKGLGGFHLACDALNADAVRRLRERKYREDKPYALMAATTETIERYCHVSELEKQLLTSRERPIVLLDKRTLDILPESVAPRLNTLGFMLPYTPLHHLLLEQFDRPLIMTSGNISDEPIAYRDDAAKQQLNTIADYFLFHDRPIYIRTDDSVVRAIDFRARNLTEKRDNGTPKKSQIVNRKSQILTRRSRGHTPAPITTSFRFKRQILACGAELKNTFCLTRGDHAYVSHHIGDLENLETLRSFTEGIEHFKRVFDLHPEVIAYDLHLEYLSTKYALACGEIEEKVAVQHHHAHIASCLVDNGVEGEVIGVAMDGLGFGTDGKLWGGEFFVADLAHPERVAHLDYVPLPGGARAIREPWRLAAVYLQRTFGDEFLNLDLPFVRELDHSEWKILKRMSDTRTNSPETSSMGRLFDAVSALLGVRKTINYEGQAAIELESIAANTASGIYQFELADSGIIRAEPVIEQLVADLLDGCTAAEVSARFHSSVADLIRRVARQVRDERNLDRIALSGGVFQNVTLLRRACELLELDGFEVLIHRRVPTNDGGISLGQAAVANAWLK
jgi:hydrogenase maturation protein HypF